jgi:prepilin-type processing-associated H-X9-DG protein
MIQCVSNHKQIIMAHLSYADDYNGYLVFRAPVGTSSYNWEQLLSGFDYPGTTMSKKSQKYLSYQSLFCPSAKVFAPFSIYRTLGMLYMEHPNYIPAALTSGYFGSKPYKINDTTPEGFLILHRLKKTSELYVIADSVYLGSSTNDYTFPYWHFRTDNTTSFIHLLHTNRANIAFVDGHVQSLGKKEILGSKMQVSSVATKTYSVISQ